MPILRSIQCVTYKYGDRQKASRISRRQPSISINSIVKTMGNYYSSFPSLQGKEGAPKIINLLFRECYLFMLSLRLMFDVQYHAMMYNLL